MAARGSRSFRFVVSASLMLALAVSGSITAVPGAALAHTGGSGEDGAKHATEDLAGTSIGEIERQTEAKKVEITNATGVEPGLAPAAKPNAAARGLAASAAVNADPGVSGSWSPVIDTQVVPVFQAVLPNGKVLMWDSVGDNAAESYPDQTSTRAMVWNPGDNTFKRVDVVGYNIFCAGFAHLQNGNILVAGGNKNQDLDGIVQTHIFDWKTETWSRSSDMADGRWYPSVTEMANGEMVIIGGGPEETEVYDTNGGIRALPGFTNSDYAGRLYPFMISRPDGLLSLFGPYMTTFSVVTAGDGATVAASERDGITRDYGSFATYDIGKTLVVGGGDITEDGVANVPTKTAVVVNNNAGLNSVVTPTGSMSVGRRQHNATMLADGTVLVTGGMSKSTSPNIDLDNGVFAAERWDPATGAWTTLASASRVREYHSTATLLPDGRVLTGGGGVCGVCVEAGYLEKNIEYFTPPYLYKKDGSGQLAARPVISAAPATVSIQTSFTVTSGQAARIKKVGLVGLSDTTHSVNQGQRYVPLKFTVSGTKLTVTGPQSGGVTPPGQYMLFITNSAGVPSVAKMVQVSKAPNPLMSAVRNSGAGRCLDVPESNLESETYLWSYDCNDTKAQALTRFTDSNTLRVLGKCIDVPGSNFAAGQRIWTYECNGTSAQTWNFNSDGTIRPRAKTTLCLAVAAKTNEANIKLATCNGSALQKWTW